jgi:hypothetical protein
VFNRGTVSGFKPSTPTGGHVKPSSKIGTVLWWKYPQNQAVKNKTSLKIKRLIPSLIPSFTHLVWLPYSLPSRLTSRHHKADIKASKAKLQKKLPAVLPLNHLTALVSRAVAPKLAAKGHGLGRTM